MEWWARNSRSPMLREQRLSRLGCLPMHAESEHWEESFALNQGLDALAIAGGGRLASYGQPYFSLLTSPFSRLKDQGS